MLSFGCISPQDGGFVDTASMFFQTDLKQTYYPHVASSLPQAKHTRGGKHGRGRGSLKHKLMRGRAGGLDAAALVMAASSGGPKHVSILTLDPGCHFIIFLPPADAGILFYFFVRLALQEARRCGRGRAHAARRLWVRSVDRKRGEVWRPKYHSCSEQ